MTTIQMTDCQGVRILRLNRLEKRNALDMAMYQQLTEYLIAGERDNAIKAFLLCGDKHCFTAGNDISDFLQHPNLSAEHPAVKFLMNLTELQKPLLAAVSGPAVGIGCTLLLHCDLVYAAPSALFSLPFVDLALVPEAGVTMLLPQLCGYQKAAELLLLGENFNADTAHSLGLVNGIVAEDDLFQHALDKATAIAAKSPLAIQQTKRLMRHGTHQLQQHMQLELQQFAAQLQNDEAKAIFSAFFKKQAAKTSL